ncbi:MAG TPA: hypothetical protein VI704_04460 [Bacteroidota bacterium]|nr:hypothetical protein [Bacteroidota bacterium]
MKPYPPQQFEFVDILFQPLKQTPPAADPPPDFLIKKSGELHNQPKEGQEYKVVNKIPKIPHEPF